MKVLIEYKKDPSDPAMPYCAAAKINGTYLTGWSSKSYALAKERLLEKINSTVFIIPEPPPSEEVELEIEVPA